MTPFLRDHPLLSLSRSYQIHVFLGCCVVITLLTAMVPARPIAIPLQQYALAEAWPLTIAALAACLPVVLMSPHAGMEATLIVRPWKTRVCIVSIVTSLALANTMVAAEIIDRPWEPAFRNYGLAATLAFVLALVAGARIAWAGPALLILGNWLYGVNALVSTPKSWALLMYGANNRLFLLSLGLLGLSATAWVIFGSRRDAQVP